MTTPPKGKRAAIYVRISKDKTGAGLGVTRQEKDCRALAKRLGVTVTEVYIDNDLSAYSGKPRPEYTRMLEDIKAGKVDSVLTWHTDRLHRSTRELEEYIDVARDVPAYAVQAGHLDLTTPSGRAVAKTLGAWAQHEVELKSERQKAKNKQLAEAGLPMGGGRPFGFEPDGITHREEEAEVIREITYRVIAGDSLASIIRDLNDRDVKTTRGNGWRYSSLRDLVTRERNAGLSVHRGHVVGEAQWEPIVPVEELRAVKRILSDPSRRTTTGNTRKHLLSGMARCHCGSPMKPGAIKDRNGEKYMMYRCYNRGPGHAYRSIPKVDEYVSRVTLMVLSDLRIRRALLKAANVDTSKLKTEQTKVNNKLDLYAEMLDSDEMTRDQFRTLSNKLRDQLKQIEFELDSAGSKTVFGDLLTEEDIEAKWGALSIERKRAIIDALMTVTIHPVGRKGRGPQPVAKGVKIVFRESGSGIVGGTLPKDLERKIVAAFGEAA